MVVRGQNFLVMLVLVASVLILHAETPLDLSDVQKLQAENHLLRIANATCRATVADRDLRLVSAELSAEQTKLEAEFRAALKPAEDTVFNWETKAFEAKPKPARIPPAGLDGKK